MDYELNSNSWENEFDNNPVAADNGFQMSGASTGGGGVLKDTTNSRSSHYSNRNSHPLTEREMEQGLQNIEGQKGIDMKKVIFFSTKNTNLCLGEIWAEFEIPISH